jgi:OPA family glycerol-3-phosphate transporter-like MFS transporter
MPPAKRSYCKRDSYARWRWQVFFITWLAYVGFYLTRKSFSVAKVELARPQVLGWDKAEMAWVDSAFLVTYAFGNFPWGPLGDRFGPRSVLLTGMFGSVVAATLMGASTSVLVIGLLFAFQGLCQSSGWGPLTKNLGAFFSLRERGFVLGLWCSNMALGAFLGSALAGASASEWGWRFAFWVPAGCQLLICLGFILLQRNGPEDVGLPPIEKDCDNIQEDAEGSWRMVASVLKNRMVWLLAAAYLLLKPTRYLFMGWAPLYLNERLGSGAAESGILSGSFDLAGLLSMVAGGYLSDKLFNAKRMPMSVLALIGGALILFSFGFLPPTRLALGLGLFGIGFMIYIPESLLSGAAAVDFGTRKGAATASSLINGAGSVGAILGGTLPGWIGRIVGPTQGSWNPIFVGLGLGLLLAAALLIPQWHRLPGSPNRQLQGSLVSESGGDSLSHLDTRSRNA